MAKISILKKLGEQIFPITSSRAVYMDDGRTVESAVKDGEATESKIESMGFSKFNGSYNALTDKPTIPTTPADYIVETGTSGIWTYEKWASGKAVAWGKYTISGYSWTAWGSYGYETSNSTLQSPPSGVFVGNPLVFPVMWDEAGNTGIISAETWKYNNGSFLVRGIRLKDNKTPATPTITVHVEMKGKWK